MGSGIDLGIDQLTDAEIIGRGGFSTVYAATDTQFDRRVAVKVLRELSKESDRNRFDRECRIMGRLSSHPNVVTLYNAGFTSDDEPYMIMELNEEGTLADLLAGDGPLRWREALQLMIPVLRALHHAHEAGVLHRDVKPENILLAGGVPRLTDFGIAYLRDSTGATSTNITASWLHTAPETFDNERDERSDVYSAASTLYNLIAGRAPFENPDDESLNPLIRRLLSDAPPPLPPGTAPASLSAYVGQALAKDPAERPVSAAAMADGLQVILDSGGLKPPVDGVASSHPRPVAPDPAPGRPITPAGRPVSAAPVNAPPASGGPAGRPASGGGPAADTRSMPGQTPPAPWAPPSTPVAAGFAPPGAGAPGVAPPGQVPPGATPPQGYPSPSNPAGGPTPLPGYAPPPAALPMPHPMQPSARAGAGSVPPLGHGGQRAGAPPSADGGSGASAGRTLLLVLLGVAGVVFVASIGGIALLRGDGSESATGTGNDPPASPTEETAGEEEAAPPGEEGASDLATTTATVDETGFDPTDRPAVVLPAFDGPADSIEELEARWAENRAAVVTALSASGYGVDGDNVLHGPGGFTVDLGACPAGWSDTEGIDGSTIRIGQTVAASGTQAGFADLATGMQAYFEVVNAGGGIDGRSIELLIRDDGYEAGRTIQEVETLLADDDVFAVTTLGSPNTLATRDRLNQSCVPQPFVATGHPATADPVAYPFTVPHQMTWDTEAVLWGAWIEANMVDQLPVRVAAVAMDNDFGLSYTSPFESWAEANPDIVSEVVVVPHAPTATALDGEMAQVVAADADVFIAMTAGTACGQAVLAGESAGLGAEVRFLPSVCRDPSFLAAAGAAADGYLVVLGGVKTTTDPAVADDPYVAYVNAGLQSAGLDPSVGLSGSGFGFYGWTWVETLRIAAELPGGLTRSNFLLAARGMQLAHPMAVEGVAFAVAGFEDAHPIEASDIGTYDSATQQWTPGPVVAAEAATPTCSWDVNVGGCR